MDLYYKQELKVGALVIVAAVVLMAGLLWLKGQGLGIGVVTVQVRFTNVNGLQEGDDVKVSGVKVGQVKNVDLRGVGDVMVHVEVNRRNRPHRDAKMSVASRDFMGAKYLDYVPGQAAEWLEEGQVITGEREFAMMETAANLTTRASDALSGVTNFLSDTTAQQIRRTLEAVERTLDVVAQVGEGPTVGELRETLRAVQQLAVRMDSTILKPDIGKSLDQMDEIATSIREMSEGLSTATTSLGSILQRIDRGEGTLGKAVTDSTLHQDLHETLVSLRKLLDDVRERPGRYVNVKVF